MEKEYSNHIEKCKLRLGKTLHTDYDYILKCLKYYYGIKSEKLRNFLIKYEPIFEHLSYDQLIAFTPLSDELFECSASFHYKNQTIESNATIIENCFERFRISRDIYANNDFGICYKFYDKNYGINIENNDYMEIKIKYNIFRNFMFFIINDEDNLLDPIIYLENYFPLNYFVDDNTNRLPNKDNAFQITELGFKSGLFVKTFSFELLSTPYMEFCQQNGMKINVSFNGLLIFCPFLI